MAGSGCFLLVEMESGDLAKVGQFTKRVAGADLNVAIGLSRPRFDVSPIATCASLLPALIPAYAAR